ERLPFGGRQHDAEMRHRYRMAIDRVVRGCRALRVNAVGDDLMPIQIEINPVGVASPLGTSENVAIEMARGVQGVDGKGDVKGGKAGHAACLPQARPESQTGTWVVR